jgi:hypothetical protein
LTQVAGKHVLQLFLSTQVQLLPILAEFQWVAESWTAALMVVALVDVTLVAKWSTQVAAAVVLLVAVVEWLAVEWSVAESLAAEWSVAESLAAEAPAVAVLLTKLCHLAFGFQTEFKSRFLTKLL